MMRDKNPIVISTLANAIVADMLGLDALTLEDAMSAMQNEALVKAKKEMAAG